MPASADTRQSPRSGGWRFSVICSLRFGPRKTNRAALATDFIPHYHPPLLWLSSSALSHCILNLSCLVPHLSYIISPGPPPLTLLSCTHIFSLLLPRLFRLVWLSGSPIIVSLLSNCACLSPLVRFVIRTEVAYNGYIL